MVDARPIPKEEPQADPDVIMAANMLRRALEELSPPKRRAVAKLLAGWIAEPRLPKRAGPVLDNVIALFRSDRSKSSWSASEVVAALADKAERKQIYNALNYLSAPNPTGRRILKKAGYGRYLLEDGTWIEGPV
jgi:hypothetical protein